MTDDHGGDGDLRIFAGCYLVAWMFLVLPLVAIYALGGGMSGRSFLQLPGDIIGNALEGDLLAIWVVGATSPMLLIPYWLWVEVRRWDRDDRGTR